MNSSNTFEMQAKSIAAEPHFLQSAKSKLRKVYQNRRFLSLADQALISATNMCTTIVIGRVCARQQLGLYASGLGLVLLITAIQSALITVPYTISSPRIFPDEHALYKGSTLIQQILLATLASFFFLCSGLIRNSRHTDQGLVPILFMLAIVSSLICFRDFARRISYAELHFGFALVLDAVLAISQIAGLATLALTHHLSASRALLAVGLASGLASAMWLIINWKSMHFSFTHATLGFRMNWALGRWLFASSVLWSICIDQYPWMISTLRTPSEAAIWASCYGVMAFLNPIVLAINNDAAPRIANDYARGGLQALRNSTARASVIASVITLPVLICLIIFGSRLVTLMYGAKYVGTGIIVDLLAIGIWFYVSGLSFPYGMLALRRPGIDFAVNVLCFCGLLAVGVWLVRSYGVMGAAFSYMMVQAIALIARIIGFRAAVLQAQSSLAPIHPKVTDRASI